MAGRKYRQNLPLFPFSKLTVMGLTLHDNDSYLGDAEAEEKDVEDRSAIQKWEAIYQPSFLHTHLVFFSYLLRERNELGLKAFAILRQTMHSCK